MKSNRRGSTLVDSLCGLFIITLGLGLYFQTNQMMNQQLTASYHRLAQERTTYEQILSKKK